MLEIGIDKWDIAVEGRPVRLTLKEAELLSHLSRPIGQTCSKGILLREVWGETYIDDTHILVVNIARLRQKIGGERERYIETIAGGGYRLVKANCRIIGV